MTPTSHYRTLRLLGLALLLHSGNCDNCDDLPVSNNPALRAEHPETTEIGSTLFHFPISMDGVSAMYLEPDEQEDAGYLLLEVIDGYANITLSNKSLDLNLMNPRTPKPPDTDESLRCDYSRSAMLPNPLMKLALKVRWKCVSTSLWKDEREAMLHVLIKEVNQYPPEFHCPPYYKEVNELTAIGTTIFTMENLAYDPDVTGAISSYSLADNWQGTFGTSGGASKGSITLTDKLDYNYGIQNYSINVTATDNEFPSRTSWTYLHIAVTDGDDQNPAFDHLVYDISFVEEDESAVGVPKTTDPPVRAYDLDYGINATVNYQRVNGFQMDGTTYFDIDAMNGSFTLLNKVDRENINSFLVGIKAFQVNNPIKRVAYAAVHVTILDINDNEPVMSDTDYSATIPEKLAQGMLVTTVSASDADEGDNAVFEFRLIDPKNAFGIDPKTGVVYVLNRDLIDREVTDTMTIQVYAEENLTIEKHQSNISVIHITLTDINDNNPIFYPSDSYHIDLQAPLQSAYVAGQVYANDSDLGLNGLVKYAITHVSQSVANTWFSIDENTGEISLAEDVTTWQRTVVVLLVRAQDQDPQVSERRSAVSVVEVLIEPLITTAVPTTTTLPPTTTRVASTSAGATTTAQPTSSLPTSTALPATTERVDGVGPLSTADKGHTTAQSKSSVNWTSVPKVSTDPSVVSASAITGTPSNPSSGGGAGGSGVTNTTVSTENTTTGQQLATDHDYNTTTVPMETWDPSRVTSRATQQGNLPTDDGGSTDVSPTTAFTPHAAMATSLGTGLPLTTGRVLVSESNTFNGTTLSPLAQSSDPIITSDHTKDVAESEPTSAVGPPGALSTPLDGGGVGLTTGSAPVSLQSGSHVPLPGTEATSGGVSGPAGRTSPPDGVTHHESAVSPEAESTDNTATGSKDKTDAVSGLIKSTSSVNPDSGSAASPGSTTYSGSTASPGSTGSNPRLEVSGATSSVVQSHNTDPDPKSSTLQGSQTNWLTSGATVAPPLPTKDESPYTCPAVERWSTIDQVVLLVLVIILACLVICLTGALIYAVHRIRHLKNRQGKYKVTPDNFVTISDFDKENSYG